MTAIPTTSELTTSEDIYKEVENWHKEAKDLQMTAKTNGDIKTALLGLDKALRCLELMLKIHGQIQEQKINVNLQQANIYQSPGVAHETAEQRLARYKSYFDEMDARERGEIKSPGESETEIQEIESETAAFQPG